MFDRIKIELFLDNNISKIKHKKVKVKKCKKICKNVAQKLASVNGICYNNFKCLYKEKNIR